MIPRSTYRVQFHAGFTFADAAACVDYWADLGISHLYASPIATARAGSMHGYDVVDPTRINPELGGETGFRALCAALRHRGIGVILDIVPNHMAVGGDDNPWWLDVLEKGAASPYAAYFDIDWRPADPELRDRLLAPFLGSSYAEAVEQGDLVLEVDPEAHCLSVVAYGRHRFPIRPDDYPEVLAAVEALDLWDIKPRLLHARFDGRTEAGRRRLHALLERQVYRLADWRTARDRINWRRFFDITELAGLRVEDPGVFDAVHALPLRLYREGLIDGVRIDHVDGLADPATYVRRLRAALDEAGRAAGKARADGPAYLVVEKILARGEPLPADWGLDGESGYAFMNSVSALLHDPAGAAPLGDLWAEVSGRSAVFEDEEALARRTLLANVFAAQHEAATAAFHRLASRDLALRDHSRPAFHRVLAALLGVFPRYRFYGLGEPVGPEEAAAIDDLGAAARRALDVSDHATLALVLSWMKGEGTGEPLKRRDALRRLAQLSAPIAAKAVEDTAFYRYGRLLSRNDVGFDPDRLGARAADFHADMLARADFPHRMNATATHDHKRGEDARARLSVLSEIPDVWRDWARRWLDLVDRDGISAGDAHLLHQTLVGAWPLDLDPANADGVEALVGRVEAWQLKALREAKLRSSWMAPDEAYETVARDYLHRFLADDRARGDLAEFVQWIAPAGVARTHAQTTLRLTVPGVPDLYQGTETWDFSLVDPDNRRPVNFSAPPQSEDWRAPWRKYQRVRDVLQLRGEHPDLFARGAYQPLEIEGPRAEEALAFARIHEDQRLIVLVALRSADACIRAGRPDPGVDWWGDTGVRLEDGEAGRMRATDILGDRAAGWRLI